MAAKVAASSSVDVGGEEEEAKAPSSSVSAMRELIENKLQFPLKEERRSSSPVIRGTASARIAEKRAAAAAIAATSSSSSSPSVPTHASASSVNGVPRTGRVNVQWPPPPDGVKSSTSAISPMSASSSASSSSFTATLNRLQPVAVRSGRRSTSSDGRSWIKSPSPPDVEEREDQRKEVAPPIPAHNHGPRSVPSSPTQLRRPPPLPTKPPIAAKPQSLTLKRPSTSTPMVVPPLPISPKPPLIRVQSEEEDATTPCIETPRAENHEGQPVPSPSFSTVMNEEGAMRVRERAKMFEDKIKPKRPSSMLSESSSDDGAVVTERKPREGDSDDDDFTSEDTLTPTPQRLADRRASNFVYGDTEIHEGIIAELKRQGMVRDSIRPPYRTRGGFVQAANREIPPGVGKVREESKKVSAAQPAEQKKTAKPTNLDELDDSGHNSAAASSVGEEDISLRDPRDSRDSALMDQSRAVSMAGSDRSSSTTLSDLEMPIYSTGDEAEDKRLKSLHHAAYEIYKVQSLFVQYLKQMGEVYPAYLQEYSARSKVELLGNINGVVHPVLQISKHYRQILPIHEKLLKDLRDVIQQWDSNDPNLADVLMESAEFIKVCKMFLLEKKQLTEMLGKAIQENQVLDGATHNFETKILKRGVGGVPQQLDQVHQNLGRYKLLAQNYGMYLKEGSEEKKKTERVIEKFDRVVISVNEALGYPTSGELKELYDRLSYKFDVFKMGRRLVKQGEANKQTRKDLQPRYLVLFDDYLLICHIKQPFNQLEISRNGVIHTEHMRVNTDNHEDHERELDIIAREKSVRLVFESVKVRNEWLTELQKTHKDRRETMRRKSEVLKKQNSMVYPETASNPIQASVYGAGEGCSEEDGDGCEPVTPDDELNGNPLATRHKVPIAEVSQPLWIPDDRASTCLMEGCETVFGVLKRRHHCRNCGWLICGDCMGEAPVPKKEFTKQNVCPECYALLWKKFETGVLFPGNMQVRYPDGSSKIVYGKKAKDPKSLFKAPVNYDLKKQDLKALTAQTETDLVYGKIYMRSGNKETVRHARLMDGMLLYVYKAEFDKTEMEKHFLHGFALTESSAPEGGTIFTLTHRNQVTTDRKETTITFRVENENLARKWFKALQDGLLVLPKADESNNNAVQEEEEVES